MKLEIRDGRLHISGYVNAVERDSKVISTIDGRCVEQIAAGAFAASLADGHEVRMKLNHGRDIGSTADGSLTLKEDTIGLYAEAVTDDEELRTLAEAEKLTGWSFGFVKKDGELEERGKDIPKRRRIRALDLKEVSILSVTPAYNGTSVNYECRNEDGTELRNYADYLTAEDGAPSEGGTEKRAADPVRAKVEHFLMSEKIKQFKREQRDMEIRALIRWAKESQAELEKRYDRDLQNFL